MNASKKTAMSVNAKPNKDLLNTLSGLNKDTTILDFGAGNGRNSNALRELGFTVYSYDPYNGNKNADPYKQVSSVLPANTFDYVFTAFVLNVVDKNEAANIINSCESLTTNKGNVIHLVREDLRSLKGKSKITAKGTYQRDVTIQELTSLGYKRKGKIFTKTM